MYVHVYCILISAALLWQAQAVSGDDITTTCPSNGFTQGETARVNCTVDRTVFATTCTGTINIVKFSFMSASGVESDWCSTSYQTCTSTGSSSVACNNCTCGCVDDSDQSAALYQLTFLPNIAHGGGNLTCAITCVIIPPGSQSQPTSNNALCVNISVGSATTQPATDEGCPPSSTCALGLGLGLGLGIPGIIGIIFTAWWCWKKPCGKSTGPGPNAENPQKTCPSNGHRESEGLATSGEASSTPLRQHEKDGLNNSRHAHTENSPSRQRTGRENVELSTVREASKGSPEDREPQTQARPLPTPRTLEPLQTPSSRMPSVERISFVNPVSRQPVPPISRKE